MMQSDMMMVLSGGVKIEQFLSIMPVQMLTEPSNL